MLPRPAERQLSLASQRAAVARAPAPIVVAAPPTSGQALQRRLGNAGLSTMLARQEQRVGRVAANPSPVVARSPAQALVAMAPRAAERQPATADRGPGATPAVAPTILARLVNDGQELQRRLGDAGDAGPSTMLAAARAGRIAAKPSASTVVARFPAQALVVSAPSDPAEREAEKVGRRVMAMSPGPAAAPHVSNPEAAKIARAAAPARGPAPSVIDPEIGRELEAAQSGGSPLPEAIRNHMERGFHADFSRVRIHTDERAGRLSVRLGARAFTRGNHIYFARGSFSPDTRSGGELIAHELTHTIQQGHAVQHRVETPSPAPATPQIRRQATGPAADARSVADQLLRVPSRDPAEHEATASAAAVLRMVPPAGAAGSEPAPRTEQHARAPLRADAGPRPPARAETFEASEDVRSPASGEKAPEGPHQDPAYQAIVRQLRTKAKAQKKPPKEPREKQLETRLAANLTPQEARKQEAIPAHIDALAQAEPPDLTTDAFMAQFGAAVKSLGEKLPHDEDEQEHVSTVVAIAVESGKAKGNLANQTQTIVGPLRTQAGKKLSDFPVTEAPEPHQLKTDPPGTVPSVPNAGAAAVKPKANAEITLDDKSRELDDVMANHQVQGQKLDIDEASLALPISGEPTFDEAGEAKRKAQQEIAKSKPRYRDHEQHVIGVSRAEMREIASSGLVKQHDSRSKSFAEVLGVQNTHKSKIEKKKREILNKLEGIYGETKKNVDLELKKLERIEDIFDAILSEATAYFNHLVENDLEYIYTPGLLDYSDWKDKHAAEIAKARDALQSQGENFYVAATKAVDIVRKRSADALFTNARSIFVSDLRSGIQEKIAKTVVEALNAARGHIRSGKERARNACDELTPEERRELVNVLSGVMGRFETLEESVEDRQREIVTDMARAYNQGIGKLHATFDAIKKNVLTSWFEKAWNKLKAVVNAIIEFATRIAHLLGRLAHLIGKIVASPRAFFSHLGEGISQGFSTFIDRIDEFLATAFFDWLRGSSGLPFQMPKDWSPKGLFGVFTQLLNLSVETVWQRVEVVYGKATASAFRQGEVVLEKGLEIFSIIRTEGLGGLWDHISESLGNMLAETLDTIKETVLYAAIRKVIIEIGKLMVPGGGFIAIAEKVIRFLQFIVDARDRILDLIESFVDAVEMAVNGNVQGIVNRITGALTKFITLALDFLVNLFGLGALKDKVTRFIERMRQPVIRGIDWLLEKFKPVVTRGMRLLQKGKQKLIGAGKAVVAAVLHWWQEKRQFVGIDGARHTIRFEGGASARLIVNPDPPTEISVLLQNIIKKDAPAGQAGQKEDSDRKAQAKAALTFYRKHIHPVQQGSMQKDLVEQFGVNLTTLSTMLMKIVGAKYVDLPPPAEVEWNLNAPKSAAVDLLSTRSSGGGSPPSQDPEGWRQLQESGLTKLRGDWKKMHMITAGVGGPGTANNLIPAPTSVNSGGNVRGFELRLEELVKRQDGKTRKNNVVWVKVTTRGFHPADPDGPYPYDGNTYVRGVVLQAGLYFADLSKKQWIKNQRAEVSASEPIPAPDFIGGPIDINTIKRTYLTRVTKVSDRFAMEILEVKGNERFTSLTSFNARMRENRKANKMPITDEFRASLALVAVAYADNKIRFGERVANQ